MSCHYFPRKDVTSACWRNISVTAQPKLDDHWRVMHALPGDGQNRPSVGDSLIQIQERYNTLSNIQAELTSSEFLRSTPIRKCWILTRFLDRKPPSRPRTLSGARETWPAAFRQFLSTDGRANSGRYVGASARTGRTNFAISAAGLFPGRFGGAQGNKTVAVTRWRGIRRAGPIGNCVAQAETILRGHHVAERRHIPQESRERC